MYVYWNLCRGEKLNATSTLLQDMTVSSSSGLQNYYKLDSNIDTDKNKETSHTKK